MNVSSAIKLNPVPSEYLQLFNSIMEDARLQKKMDRSVRLNEMFNHVDFYFPKIKKGKLKILDVATGPGEFLEVVKFYKCNGIGIDINESHLNNVLDIKGITNDYFERFKKYIQFSRINAIRQKLNVIYSDMLDCIMLRNDVFNGLKFNVINCQLAMHLILKNNFNFENVFKNNDIGSWVIDDLLVENLSKTMNYFYNHLKFGGILLIETDKAANLNQFSELIISIAIKQGLNVEYSNNLNIYKFIKIGFFQKLKKNLMKTYLIFKK